MKKSFVVSLSILCSLLIFAGCSSSTSSSDTTTADTNWEKIEKNKTLTVATSGTLYPASYYNDDNQLVGYDIDVIKEVAKRLDLKVKTAEYNVDGQLAAVQNGSADLIANDMSINETRAKKYTLSSPIKWSFGSMIVRRSDNSGITSFDDLKGKKAAGEATTNYMKIAESMSATLINWKIAFSTPLGTATRRMRRINSLLNVKIHFLRYRTRFLLQKHNAVIAMAEKALAISEG